MTSMLSSLCCYSRCRRKVSAAEPAQGHPQASHRPGLMDRLSGLATAACASAQLGLAIGAAVTTGLVTKAGYVAAMMAGGLRANQSVSTGIVLGSTLVVQSGVGALIEGVRCKRQDQAPMSPALAASMKTLGVAAYLTAMLGSAFRAMQDEDTQPLGAYMLANAAGQVLSSLMSELVAARLVRHALVETHLVDGQGQVMELASRPGLRNAGEAALALGQLLTHAALMWGVMDKIPAVQQGLGVPADFEPGQDGALDHLLAGLGVAAVVGASEILRVAAGEMAMAMAQTAGGATLKRGRGQPGSGEHSALVSSPPARDEEVTLSRWSQCRQDLSRVADRLGLGPEARGRMASYAPILNLYVDALTTGPHSRLIQDMARQMKKPVFEVAVGVANFTYALLNVADVVLRARPAPSAAASSTRASSDYGATQSSSTTTTSSSQCVIELEEPEGKEPKQIETVRVKVMPA